MLARPSLVSNMLSVFRKFASSKVAYYEPRGNLDVIEKVEFRLNNWVLLRYFYQARVSKSQAKQVAVERMISRQSLHPNLRM